MQPEAKEASTDFKNTSTWRRCTRIHAVGIPGEWDKSDDRFQEGKIMGMSFRPVTYLDRITVSLVEKTVVSSLRKSDRDREGEDIPESLPVFCHPR